MDTSKKLIVKMPWNFLRGRSNAKVGGHEQEAISVTSVDDTNMPSTLRPRNAVNEGASTSAYSRSSAFNRKVRETFPERYEAFKKKDALRQKARYTPVEDLSARLKNERRLKWKLNKQSQRKTQGAHQQKEQKRSRSPSEKKKMKTMTLEEKREDARLRQQKCRANATRQKQARSRAVDRLRKKTASTVTTELAVPTPTTSLSCATVKRRITVVKQVLPSTPRSFAKVVSKVIESTTPRKREALIKTGVGVRRSLEDELLLTGIKYSIKETNKIMKTSENVKRAKIILKAALVVGKSKRKMTRHLGVSWRLLGNELRRKRSGEVMNNSEVSEKVKEHWLSEEVSRCLPLKKRVKKGKPMYLLEMTYMNAFKSFKLKHPEIKLGYVTFIKLKPKNVRHLKAAERIVCVCIKCENASLKLQALNRLIRQSSGLNENLRMPNIKALSDQTLCNYTDQPEKRCIDRCCSDCGTSRMKDRYNPLITDEEIGSKEVRYDGWEYRKEKRMSKSGEKVISAMSLITHVCTVRELVNLLIQNMESLSSHLFRSVWQQTQFAKYKSNIPPRGAVVVMDFAENYACSMQNEVQSYHWCQQQATVHPVVAYVNASETERGIVTHIIGLVFITDDRKHDVAAVAAFTDATCKYLSDNFHVDRIDRFTDCCAAQYRSKHSFAELLKENGGMQVNYHYFESSHGKSASDGLGAVVKHSATMAVTRREAVIRNARELYDYCLANLETVGDGPFASRLKEYKNSRRKFFYLDSCEIIRSENLPHIKAVKGTMVIHCVVASTSRNTAIESRQLSCACNYCMYNEGAGCINEHITGKWSVIDVMTTSQHGDVEDDSSAHELSSDSEDDASDISEANVEEDATNMKVIVDDTCFVLVRPAEEFYDYYLIKCAGTIYMMLIKVTNSLLGYS